MTNSPHGSVKHTIKRSHIQSVTIKPSSCRSLELYNHYPPFIADVSTFPAQFLDVTDIYLGSATAWAYESTDTSNRFVQSSHGFLTSRLSFWVSRTLSRTLAPVPMHHLMKYHLLGPWIQMPTSSKTTHIKSVTRWVRQVRFQTPVFLGRSQALNISELIRKTKKGSQDDHLSLLHLRIVKPPFTRYGLC